MRFITFLLVLIPYITHSQEIAFSRWDYDFGYERPRMHHLVVAEDTLVMYGQALAGPDSLTDKRGILVAMFDTLGNVIDTTFIQDESPLISYRIASLRGTIIKTEDAGYVFTASISNGLGGLFKLDHQLNLSFVRFYGEHQSNVDYTVRPTENGFLLFGSVYTWDDKAVGIVRYVDKEGEPIWERLFNTEAQYLNSTIDDVEVYDDSIVIVGRSQVTPFPTNEFVSFVEVMDMQGGTIRKWQSEPDSEFGSMLDIVDKRGEDLVIYGGYPKMIIDGEKYFQSYICRLDEVFEPVWYRTFGEVEKLGPSDILNHFVETKNGNYLGIGHHEFTLDNSNNMTHGAWLYHFSPLGDSIWGMNIPPPETGFLDRGEPNTGGVLSSGSIILGGWWGGTNGSYPWLVKLYCSDTLFCGEQFVQSGERAYEEYELELSPNPATENINVAVHPDSGYDHLKILGMDGREYFSVKISGAEVNVDVRFLPPGIYVLRAEGERGYANAKFVKE